MISDMCSNLNGLSGSPDRSSSVSAFDCFALPYIYTIFEAFTLRNIKNLDTQTEMGALGVLIAVIIL